MAEHFFFGWGLPLRAKVPPPPMKGPFSGGLDTTAVPSVSLNLRCVMFSLFRVQRVD